jgi:hypothetical protein
MQLRYLNITTAVATGAGLFGIWRASAFVEVVGLDSWEEQAAEDTALRQHIDDGSFVPINIGGDGSFQMAVRGVETPGQLDERESQYLLVSSKPYLIISDGFLELGGLEAVGSYSGAEKVEVELDEGRYCVVIHLLDWKAEPGSVDADGNPTSSALSDFVIEVFKEPLDGLEYRLEVETFERS